MAESEKITKDTIIYEVIAAYGEKAAQIFLDHGIHCIGCHFSMYETLEQGTAVHGLPLEPLLNDLNTLAQSEDKKETK
jgi:hybrid cluster-associated redox disulfide protein